MKNTTTTKQTATECYAARKNEIEKMIAELQSKLAAHAAEQAADSKNWGFAGDLGRIAANLKEINDSINN
jgi:hypothetical protein